MKILKKIFIPIILVVISISIIFVSSENVFGAYGDWIIDERDEQLFFEIPEGQDTVTIEEEGLDDYWNVYCVEYKVGSISGSRTYDISSHIQIRGNQIYIDGVPGYNGIENNVFAAMCTPNFEGMPDVDYRSEDRRYDLGKGSIDGHSIWDEFSWHSDANLAIYGVCEKWWNINAKNSQYFKDNVPELGGVLASDYNTRKRCDYGSGEAREAY